MYFPLAPGSYPEFLSHSGTPGLYQMYPLRGGYPMCQTSGNYGTNFPKLLTAPVNLRLLDKLNGIKR